MPRHAKKSNFASRVKKIVNQSMQSDKETYHKEFAWNQVSIQDSARTPLTVGLNEIASGSGPTQRNGNQLRVTGIYSKFALQHYDATNLIRVMLVIPKDPSITTLTGIGLFSNLDIDQYTVLYDHLYNISQHSNKVVTIKRKFNKGRFRGIETQYFGSGATDFAKNRMLLYMVSDSTAIGDPTVTGTLRLFYHDN